MPAAIWDHTKAAGKDEGVCAVTCANCLPTYFSELRAGNKEHPWAKLQMGNGEIR